MNEKKHTPARNTDTYAIWLKPENEVYNILKSIINSLSDEYDAPKFEPHITVAGSIHNSVDKLEDLVRKVGSECEPMTLYLKETDFRDSFYRSLFVHIAPNDALLALREHCLRELKLEHKPYMPHISLMYKKMDPGMKRDIMNRVGNRFDLVFSPEKLYLVRTTGEPDTWREIMSAPLKKKFN